MLISKFEQMKNRKLYFFLTFLLSYVILPTVIFAQVEESVNETQSQNLTEEKKSEFELIHFGDTIDVDVLGSVDYDWRGTISPEGFLDSLTGIPDPVFTLCQTEEEVSLKIAAAYSKFLRDPKVVVRIIDKSKRPVSTIFGAIKNQQRFQILRPVFLNELIVFSGGFTDQVSGEIQIFRPRDVGCVQQQNNQKQEDIASENGENKEKFVPASQENASQIIKIDITDLLSGEKTANPQIYSGDIITILEAQPIYVTGGVENPGQISSRSEISLTRAIASAGGISKKADESDITIFRRENNTTKVIKADLKKIREDESLDIKLKPFDIIDVKVRGGNDKELPPVLEISRNKSGDTDKLPLRIID